MPDPRQMRVLKYIPEKLYGFAGDAVGQVFFHLGVFDPKGGWMRHPQCENCPRGGCPWTKTPPPPVPGELVLITLEDGSVPCPVEGQHAPRAVRAERVHAPVATRGTVETFDAQRGYGFILGDDRKNYYLHRCEVTENKIPLPGQRVMFYAGTREDRPRACHVRICLDQTA